jgi:hypothetical protein
VAATGHSPVNRRDLPEAGYRYVPPAVIERFVTLSGNYAVTPRIVPPLARSGRVTSECNLADARVVRDETITSGLLAVPGGRRQAPACRRRARREPAQTAAAANNLAMMIIAGTVEFGAGITMKTVSDTLPHRTEPPSPGYPAMSIGCGAADFLAGPGALASRHKRRHRRDLRVAARA